MPHDNIQSIQNLWYLVYIYKLDDFYKDDSRNLGVRIETRSYQGTISEEESSELLEKIVNILEKKFKITLNRRGWYASWFK